MSTLEELFDDPTDLPPPPGPQETSAPEPVAAVEPAEDTPEVEGLEASEPPAQEPEPSTAPEGEEPASGEAPSPPSVDWKKRYDDVRRQQMQGLTTAQQRAAFAETQLQAMLAERAKPQQTQDFSQIADKLRSFATAQGYDEQATRQLAEIISDVATYAATEQTQPLSQQLQAAQEAQRSLYASQTYQAVQARNDDVLVGFQTDNPDITPEHQQAMIGFLAEIGELEQGPDGTPIPTPDDQGYRTLSREALDAALEAARNPSVAQVIRAQPEWAYTPEGLALAKRLASPEQGTTQPRTTAQVDAALAAAQTLSGPSGTRPGAAPVQDEIDDLLRAEAPKVFSR